MNEKKVSKSLLNTPLVEVKFEIAQFATDFLRDYLQFLGSGENVEEDEELLKAGFEYVTERHGIKLYRRPKIFAKYMDKR